MSNSYFQFKRFLVNQDRCAMKVCTDACLFGAWVAGKLERGELITENVLDIGTGTGLLSLMVAQKAGCFIDAVEIDPDAAEQAAGNFSISPWKNRLKLIRGDIKELPLSKNYDLIISNPPFFENDLKSPDQQRNLALHSEALSLTELVNTSTELLTDNGHLAVLLPYHRKDHFLQVSKSAGFYLKEEIDVQNSLKPVFFRSMLLFRKKKAIAKSGSMIIRENDSYSAAFTSLLQDYYLNL